MSEEEVPPSIKSPLSLRADYADPLIYGWASAIVGFLGLLTGVITLAVSRSSATVVVIIIGAILLLAGITLIVKGD